MKKGVAVSPGIAIARAFRIEDTFARHDPLFLLDDAAVAAELARLDSALAAVAAGRTAGRAKVTDHAALDDALCRLGAPPIGGTGPIDDHSADALLTAAWLRTAAPRADLWKPVDLTPELARTEGWTFGVP